MNLLTHTRDVWRGRKHQTQAMFSAPGVGRRFMVCKDCRRVVPSWRLVVEKPKPGYRFGCRCGCTFCQPRVINDARAMYWVLVRGLLLRRLLQWRTDDWDPRLAEEIAK